MPEPIFADTSTVIASELHSPKVKRLVSDRLTQHSIAVISNVVRREFVRRVLREARYLIENLEREKSYVEVFHKVRRLFGKHDRKRNICLDLLARSFPNSSDAEAAEACRLHLRNLIQFGDKLLVKKFELLPGDSCSLGKQPVLMRTTRTNKTKCDFGPKNCESTEKCEIRKLLDAKRPTIRKINTRLKREAIARTANGEKLTKELAAILDFSSQFLASKRFSAKLNNPCDRVADMLIALESEEIPNFATLNFKESLLLCEVLKQTLFVLPTNPDKSEVTHDFS